MQFIGLAQGLQLVGQTDGLIGQHCGVLDAVDEAERRQVGSVEDGRISQVVLRVAVGPSQAHEDSVKGRLELIVFLVVGVVEHQENVAHTSHTDGGGKVVAVAQDASGNAEALAYSYAAAIGCGRAGMIASTFQFETEGDLYGEQVVLCGGLTHLIRTAWEVQVEAGWPPELAYFDCLHEVKLLSDLIHERGIAGAHLAISNTAEWGEYVTGPRIITDATKAEMKRVLKDIQTGKFTSEWMQEYRAGAARFKAIRRNNDAHNIEDVGAKLREMMPWIGKNKLVDKARN